MVDKEICWHNLLMVVKRLRNSLTTTELGAELINKQSKSEVRDFLSVASRDVATTTSDGLMSHEDKINLLNKVDKVLGKGLSSNDFTAEEKQKLANLESIIDSKIDEIVETTPGTFEILREITEWIENNGVEATELSSQLALKVDKEPGKSLMSDSERTKLNSIEQGAQVNPDMSLYVLKDGDKTLSSVDYTSADKAKLDSIENGAQVNPDLTPYAKTVDVVQKQAGKGLSTNDFTTSEKQKLSGIQAGAQVNPDLSPYLLRAEIGNIATFKVWTGQVRTTESDGYITVDYSSVGFTQPPTVVATALSPNTGTDTSANNAAWCSIIQGSITNTNCRIRSKSADSAGLLAAMVAVNITTNINIIAIGQ